MICVFKMKWKFWLALDLNLELNDYRFIFLLFLHCIHSCFSMNHSLWVFFFYFLLWTESFWLSHIALSKYKKMKIKTTKQKKDYFPYNIDSLWLCLLHMCNPKGEARKSFIIWLDFFFFLFLVMPLSLADIVFHFTHRCLLHCPLIRDCAYRIGMWNKIASQ